MLLRRKGVSVLAAFLVGALTFALGVSLGLTTSQPVSVTQRSDSSAGPNGGTRAASPGKSPKLTKSYAFYVGREYTKDGSVMLAGTGEEPSSHWLEIVPHQKHPPDAMIQVGVTAEATFPGELFKIPQVDETYKYISKSYSWYAGFPAPLTNGGLNEHQVAVRDVWSPSRQKLTELTPTPQRGLNYSDLARIVLERAATAREGAEIICRLVDKYGYATYGTGNTHIIADPTEGWIVKEFPGGQGLCVAERLRPDEIRVAYPGYIGVLPENFRKNPRFIASDNFVSFAVEHGWYDPDSGEPFNVWEVYGAQDIDLSEGPKLLGPKEIEQILKDLAPVTVDELMTLVRDPRISDDEAGYGQVAQLRSDLPYPELLATLWIAPTSSVTAPFIPWHMGVQEVPPEFRKHRYLSADAASGFQAQKSAPQEATKYSVRVFKRLLYYTCSHPERFYAETVKFLETYEGRMLSDQDVVEDTALTLIEAGEKDLARRQLTYYSNRQALEALQLGAAVVKGIDARVQVLYRIEEPKNNELSSREQAPGGVDCLANRDADVASDDDALPEYAPPVFGTGK